MALVSPGINVTVTDESFYVSSGPGTVPLIIIATEQDKVDNSGTAIAQGTLAENAGKLYLVASQRELLQAFGVPKFYSVNGTSLNGYELNEYGLLAAHSYLGLANRAYILRAGVDLKQLSPLDAPPTTDPVNGTEWLDLGTSVISLYESNGSEWVAADVFVAVEYDVAGKPKNVPTKYKYAMVAGVNVNDTTKENVIYKKNSSSGWDIVSATDGSVVYASVYPAVGSSGALWFNLKTSNFKLSKFDSTLGQFVSQVTPFYANTSAAYTGFGSNLRTGSVYVEYNSKDNLTDIVNVNKVELQHSIKVFNGLDTLTVTSNPLPASGPYNLTMVIRNYDGSTKNISASGASFDSFVLSLQTALTSNGLGDITVISNSTTRVIKLERDLKDIIIQSAVLASSDVVFAPGIYSNWEALEYQASVARPQGALPNGTLWYSTEFKVDILVNDGVGNWEDHEGNLFLQSSEPTTGVVNGDIWVDTDQLDAYPVIYRRVAGAWKKVVNSDQTTPNGILFADARPTNSGALDADVPQALAYPQGMLLWNTRYSTRNVKKWTPGYTFEGNLVGDRWVSESGNDVDGSLITGNAAVKAVIVKSMQAAIQSNEDIRSENIFFNLIAAPGYVELIDEMVTLNIDRKETAFVVGDTPFTLEAKGTALQQWASNANNAASNGDKGLVTANTYTGVYYPSGLTSNLDGTNVVVPASHMALRTIAYNDQVAYQWFAPAGTQRGLVTNASSVGYVNSEGEYVPVSLSNGLRDILYTNNINPIATIPNRGPVVFGQKTRQGVSSALDRINVARLVNYVRYQADKLAQPFLFEPNDQITRNAVYSAFYNFLSELVTLRAVNDFIVVCDSSNNTNTRIDRNELWIDLYIVPVKAIEFIQIPIRIRNTGSI